jgi:hypothetical protein
MSDFQVKSDAVDVDAIMRQIRARIREKRGADYTEAEIRELAKVKLEQFIDPKGVRSDLVAQFRRQRPASAAPPNFVFEDDTIYETHRGLLRTIRRLLNPLLKLLFNPNKISSALHVQAKTNQDFHERLRQREEIDALYYELVHNLTLEVTRLSIEVHNMKMRVESVSSRLDFDERRGRALENVVQYRQARPAGGQRPQPQAPRPPAAANAPAPAPSAPMPSGAPAMEAPAGSPDAAPVAATLSQTGASPERPDGDGERRRRRRRRRRRPGQTLGDQSAAPGGGDTAGSEDGGDWAGDDGAAGSQESGPDTSADTGRDEQ